MENKNIPSKLKNDHDFHTQAPHVDRKYLRLGTVDDEYPMYFAATDIGRAAAILHGGGEGAG